jgi:hypothetical protein
MGEGGDVGPPPRWSLTVAVAALLGGLWSLLAEPVQPRPDPRSTTVAVTLTDTKLKLAPATVPLGSVVFEIANSGRNPRSFRIGGKRTPAIAAGESAALRVVFTRTGPALYSSVGQGSAAPLKGALNVIEPCTNPTASTVTVQISEAPETLSQAAIPCGAVTFVMTNVGTVVHNFYVFPIDAPHAGATTSPDVKPGQTLRVTVHFTSKGEVVYGCSLYEHGEQYGETGSFRIV